MKWKKLTIQNIVDIIGLSATQQRICFILKGKIQDLVDIGNISLLDDSVKAPIHYMFVTEEALDINESETLDEKRNF